MKMHHYAINPLNSGQELKRCTLSAFSNMYVLNLKVITIQSIFQRENYFNSLAITYNISIHTPEHI